MSDYQKAKQSLGLSNAPFEAVTYIPDTTSPTSTESEQTSSMPMPATQVVSLVKGTAAIPANAVLFSDTGALFKYLKDNDIEIPRKWLEYGIVFVAGGAVGYLIAKNFKK